MLAFKANTSLNFYATSGETQWEKYLREMNRERGGDGVSSKHSIALSKESICKLNSLQDWIDSQPSVKVSNPTWVGPGFLSMSPARWIYYRQWSAVCKTFFSYSLTNGTAIVYSKASWKKWILVPLRFFRHKKILITLTETFGMFLWLLSLSRSYRKYLIKDTAMDILSVFRFSFCLRAQHTKFTVSNLLYGF